MDYQMQRAIEQVKLIATGAQKGVRQLQAQSRPIDPGRHFFRAVALELQALATQGTFARLVEAETEAQAIIAARSNPLASIRQKTTTNPAQTTVAGWAAELIGTSVAVPLLVAPSSAFSQLAARPSVMKLDLSSGAIRLPGMSSGDLAGAWISEAAGIPVRKATISGATVILRKLGVISTFSRELARSSAFESVVRGQMDTDITAFLDGSLLDNAAASSSRPAGLLNGVAPIASAAAGVNAVATDLAALAAAVPASTDLVLIARAETRIRAGLLAPGAMGINWIDSPAAGGKQIVAVDAGSMAMAGGELDFSVSEEATLVNESTVPVPAPLSMSTSSLYQMGLLGLRAILDATWGLRASGRVAHIDALNW
jgi:hypothetical protein